MRIFTRNFTKQTATMGTGTKSKPLPYFGAKKMTVLSRHGIILLLITKNNEEILTYND